MGELFYDLRRNGPITALKALIVLLVCLSVYNLQSFSHNTDMAIEGNLTQQLDYNMFTVVDMLAEPELFSEATNSPHRVAEIAEFYDQLNADTTLKMLSVFNQALLKVQFRGDETFEHAYGTDLSSFGFYEDENGRPVLDVKSVQMNRQAFDFYGLRAQDGKELPWEDVDYASGTVPVLLGNDFKPYYAVGDIIEGWMYSNLKFKVVGFLEQNSSIPYQGEPNFYLDRHILIPRAPRLNGCAELETHFCGIMAVAMINSDIAVPKSVGSEEVFRRLNAIGERSGFTDFTLTNAPIFLVQLGFMRQLIEDNRGLLHGLELVIIAAACVVLYVLNRFLSRRREAKTRVWAMLGAEDARVVAQHRRFWLLEYACAFVLLVLVARNLPNRDDLALMGASLLLLGIAFLDTTIQRGMVLRVLRSTREAK
ncbi:hypothetical protein [Actinobaculum sp. 313]|uniref:hypothetical protein n=1 Tax=Actinobaculum sp. 313 TaxID=2495645 RepID=UPI0013DE43A2|nr:hypothetical protein [Actinobaculum sp. 313]